MTVDLRHGAATDIGLARDVNEDSYLAAPPLFVVADGMGGHTAGDVASRIAVETLSREVADNSSALADAVREANRTVHQESTARPELSGMGTTITAMVAGDQTAEIVHVGDSRAYLLRSGSITRITRDHTLVERLVREGRIQPDEADHHPQRSYLERALGVDREVEVDSYKIPTQPGDRILLCTDGLTTMLDEDEIRDILEGTSDPERASRGLVAAAVDAGGSDNITVVVVDYPSAPEEEGKTRAAPSVRGPRGKAPRRTLMLAGAVVALGMVLFIAVRAAALTQWYVGSSDGNVAIYRGVPWFIHKVEKTTDISAASLPEVYREQLKEGISADNEGDALLRVANLREISREHGPTPEAATPAPGAGP